MLWLLLGCRPEPVTSPDIVILLAAGLRSDTTDVLLEGLQRTPSARFTAAYSQSSSPFVSLGSLLIGDYPAAAPMCGLTVRSGPPPDPPIWCNQLPEGRWTLPEVLETYSYRTALFTNNLRGGRFLAGEFQVGRESTDPASDAVAWWKEGNGPRLLVIADASPMMRRTTFWAEQQVARPDRSEVPGSITDMRTEPLEAAQEAYQEEIRALGQRWRTLLDGLSGEEELLILAGLNGINLGEQSGSPTLPPIILFNDIILERTVHVPLMVFSQTPLQLSSDDPVELLDVLPTVVAAAGAMPVTGLPGRDLLDGTPEADSYAYSELGDMISLRKGEYMLSFRGMLHHATSLDPKLTQVLMGKPHRLMLHNVVHDPAQGNSLTREKPALADQLLDELRAVRLGPAAPSMDVLTPELVQQLRAVQRDGYW